MSEPLIIPVQFDFSRGFFPSQPLRGPGVIPSTYIDGQNIWNGTPRPYTDRGTLNSGASGSPRPLMLARTLVAGMTGGGSVIHGLNTDWYAGSGNAVLGGVVLGASGGILMLMVSGVAVPAGLAVPPAPTVTVSTAVSSFFTGSYSIRVCAFRSTTGAISTRSAQSATISPKLKQAHVVFGTPVSGQTHWILGGTPKGLGSSGLTRFITASSASTYLMYPVVALGGPAFVDIDWHDGELGAEMPLNYDPPPSGVTHCAIIGKSMILFTANGKVYQSIVGLPEAYPPEFITSLPIRETVTGMKSDVLDGATIGSTANQFFGLFPSNTSDNPTIIRPLMKIGCSQGNAWDICLGNQIYGFAGNRIGFFRTHGAEEPDRSFAIPVQKFAEDNSWTDANVFVCDAPNNQGVIYAGPGGGGGRALIYHTAGTEEYKWSGPIELPGVPAGALTRGNIGLVDVGGTLYQLDAGGAGGTFFARTPQYSSDGRQMTTDSFWAEGESDMTLDVQTVASQGGSPATLGTPFPTTLATMNNYPLKPNRKFRNACLRVSGTGGGKVLPGATLVGIADPATGRF